MRITQKHLVFYKLYKQFKQNKEVYLDSWEFCGLIAIPELGHAYLASYKTPQKLSDIFNENPDFLERRKKTFQGSTKKYFQYRITNTYNPVEKLIDPILLAFYKIIKV